MYSGKSLVPELLETVRLIEKERRSRHPVRKAWRRVFGERKWKRKVSACDEDYRENVVWEHHAHQDLEEHISFIGPLQNPEVAGESSEDDWFLQAHPSMESLYNKAISTDVFVTAHQSLESLYNEELSTDDVFVTAHQSLESLYNEELSTDDVFVTAHQSLESLYNEELSTDEVFVTAKTSSELNRQVTMEGPEYYIRQKYPIVIYLEPPKKVSRSAQTSDCQIEEPKNPPSKMKRRAKAIKAYFNKKWKAVKRTFTQCTGDSDS